jgi:hypothetical protein
MHVVTVNEMTVPKSLLPWRPIQADVDGVIILVDIDTWWRTQLLR